MHFWHLSCVSHSEPMHINSVVPQWIVGVCSSCKDNNQSKLEKFRKETKPSQKHVAAG